MGETITVSLDMNSTINVINNALAGSITGECIDSYRISAPNGGQCHVLVYEKHFMRVENRLTLTVVIDDFMGMTRVHYVGGGGGRGLFKFDWGASQSFANTVAQALAPYRIG